MTLPELPPVPTGPTLRLSLDERLIVTRKLLDEQRLTVDQAIDCYTTISEELAMLQSFEHIDQTLYFRITDLTQELERYFASSAL